MMNINIVMPALMVIAMFTIFVAVTTIPVEEQSEPFQEIVDQIVDNLVYIKDPNTKLCFAFYRAGRSISSVNCEDVPGEILETARWP